MKNQQQSFPDRFRGLALDMDMAQIMGEYDFVASRLRKLADELEEWLKQERLEAT